MDPDSVTVAALTLGMGATTNAKQAPMLEQSVPALIVARGARPLRN